MLDASESSTALNTGKHILIFDAGNTSIKIGEYKGGVLCSQDNFGWDQLDQLNVFVHGIEKHGSLDGVFGIASGDSSLLPTLLQQGCVSTVQLNWPLQQKYDTPETLGQDRILMSSAAHLEFETDVLLVTMGTCITYNIVKNGSFLGGAISPGWSMRYRAMHDFTAGLPLVNYSSTTALLGTDTDSSLRAGVDIAIQIEVEGMIERYSHQYDIKCVVLCGGDAKRLSNPLKKYIFAPANYELHALKRIHEYFEKTGQL